MKPTKAAVFAKGDTYLLDAGRVPHLSFGPFFFRPLAASGALEEVANPVAFITLEHLAAHFKEHNLEAVKLPEDHEWPEGAGNLDDKQWELLLALLAPAKH